MRRQAAQAPDLEYDVTGIGTIGTYATLYAPICLRILPCWHDFDLRSSDHDHNRIFRIHAGGMLSSGTYTWLSGWGTSSQGQCAGCDYVIWTVGNSPASNRDDLLESERPS